MVQLEERGVGGGAEFGGFEEGGDVLGRDAWLARAEAEACGLDERLAVEEERGAERVAMGFASLPPKFFDVGCGRAGGRRR